MLGRSTALYRDRRAPSKSATHLTCEVTEDENPKLKNSSRDAYQSHLSDVAERAIVTQRPAVACCCKVDSQSRTTGTGAAQAMVNPAGGEYYILDLVMVAKPAPVRSAWAITNLRRNSEPNVPVGTSKTPQRATMMAVLHCGFCAMKPKPVAKLFSRQHDMQVAAPFADGESGL